MTQSVTQAFPNSFNRLMVLLQNLIAGMDMNPFYAGMGPIYNFNANKQVKFPAIWIEPKSRELLNSIENGRTSQDIYTLNIYCLDRINKGDSNYQDIISDTNYILGQIIGQIRQAKFWRNNYVQIADGNFTITPQFEVGDENMNGWLWEAKLKVLFNYNPCNNPVRFNNSSFNPFSPGYSVFIWPNYINAGFDQIL